MYKRDERTGADWLGDVVYLWREALHSEIGNLKIMMSSDEGTIMF